MDIWEIILDLPEKIIGLSDKLISFLTYQIEILGRAFSMWSLLGGIGLTILIIYSIARG